VQGQRPAQAAVATDDDQPIYPVLVQTAQAALLTLNGFELQVARRLQDRAAAPDDPAHVARSQALEIAGQQPRIRLPDAIHLHASGSRRAHYCPNRRVHARRVTAARQYCDASHARHAL